MFRSVIKERTSQEFLRCNNCEQIYECVFCEHCGGNPYIYNFLINEYDCFEQEYFNYTLYYSNKKLDDDSRNRFIHFVAELKYPKSSLINMSNLNILPSILKNKVFEENNNVNSEYIYKELTLESDYEARWTNDDDITGGLVPFMINLSEKSSTGEKFEEVAKFALEQLLSDNNALSSLPNVFFKITDEKLSYFWEFDGIYLANRDTEINVGSFPQFFLYSFDGSQFVHKLKITLEKASLLVIEKKSRISEKELCNVADKLIKKIDSREIAFFLKNSYTNFKKVVKLIIFNNQNSTVNYPSGWYE